MSDNLKGALLMLAAMAGFSFNDAIMKQVLGDLPLFQSVFLRGLFVIVLLGIYVALTSGLRPHISGRDWGRIMIRAMLEFAATFLFFSALLRMPFANVSAIMQALPLAVTLGAAVFLGQSFGVWRLLAIVIGFFGVMLIVRPGPEGFANGAGYALACVVVVTARDLITRTFSASVPSAFAAWITAAVITGAAGVSAMAQGWAPVETSALGLLGAASLFILVAYVTSVSAMRVGEIAFVTPFRYTALLWALVLGVIYFGEFPDGLDLVGAAIIVGMGIFTLYRERRTHR